jgi:hypothetical protein
MAISDTEQQSAEKAPDCRINSPHSSVAFPATQLTSTRIDVVETSAHITISITTANGIPRHLSQCVLCLLRLLGVCHGADL